jgi:prevent-host-death family protein
MEENMNRVIGVTEFQRKFRTIFDDVAHRRIPYVLTRGSRPEVVMLPYEQYMKLMESDEAGILARFDKVMSRLSIANAAYSDAEIEADLKAAARPGRKRK